MGCIAWIGVVSAVGSQHTRRGHRRADGTVILGCNHKAFGVNAEAFESLYASDLIGR